ncbi:MAG: DUF2589 domain-containing protein [Dysgonomonas sp.]
MSNEKGKKPNEKEVEKIEINLPGTENDKPAISISANDEGVVSASMDMPTLKSDDSGMVLGDNNENAADAFKGLPISELIAAPFTAACDAQLMLAQAAYKYMTKIGFQTDDKGNTDLTKPNLLKFNLERPVETPNGIETSTIEVQAPFLGLVPIPSLLIDNINVNFQMEVTTSTSDTEKKAAEASLEANAEFKLGLFGKGHVEMKGKVSSSRETTRNTNQTAKYQINVSASQQPQTEGLSKLMDILASCTAPLKVEG